MGQRHAPPGWVGRTTHPQHVWLDVTGGNTPPVAGLLVMWRWLPGQAAGWEGWTVASDRDGGLREGWHRSAYLKPHAPGQGSSAHVWVGEPGDRGGGPGLLLDGPWCEHRADRPAWVIWAGYYAPDGAVDVKLERVAGDRVRLA